MTNEELKIKLAEILPTATIEEAAEIGPGWITVNVEPIEWLAFAQQLRKE